VCAVVSLHQVQPRRDASHRADRRNVDELFRVAVATCRSDVGLGKALPKGSALLVPFNCTVSVGEPLYGKESYDAFVAELEAAMTALAAQEKLPVWE